MTTEILEEIKIDEKIERQVKEPKKYHVIFFNDNITPMEWVIEILKKIFHHSEETAKNLMLIVHEKGSAVVGTYSFEIAEQKATEVKVDAVQHGHPLEIKVETA